MANQVDMNDLAARGAVVRLAELRAEIDALRAAFPGLEDASANGNGMPASTSRGRRGRAVTGSDGPRRRRPAMSAAQRKAVSARMKKYWADRRKARNADK